MEKANSKIIFMILNFLLIIYGIETVFPPITTVFNSNLICMACLFGWIAVSFFYVSKYYLNQNLKYTYPLIFYFATIFIPYLLGAGVIGNRYMNLGLIPLGYFIFNYYKKHENLKSLKYISIIIAFFAMITFFTTFKALITNPYISRSIKNSGEYSASLARMGIGGYSFIYFMVVISVLLLYIFFRSKQKHLKMITMAGYIISLMFIMKSNYMTALLTVMIASVVLILSNYSQKGIYNKILLFILIVLLFFIMGNINIIIEKYADFIPSRIARVIVTGDNQSLFKSILDEFADDRLPTLRSSVEMFLKHPLLGMVGSGAVELNQSGELNGFGQHSHILDTFALFGFFIGIVNVFIIFMPFQIWNGKKERYDKMINRAMLVCVIGIYLLNNATPAIAFALGIFLPLVREIYGVEK